MRHSRKHVQDPGLAPLQAALTAPPSAEELTGEEHVLGAYRAVSWREGRSFRRPAVIATKLGLATAAGVIGLSGVATAAYTGSLPDTLQDVAHKTIKAPKAHPPTQAVGPDATGSAAYGLCQAFAKDKGHDEPKADKPEATATHEPQGHGKGLQNKPQKNKDKGASPNAERGQAKQKSVAYRNLVRAAGGEDKVEAYCASVPKPSGEPDSDDQDSGEQEHGKPTTLPTHPTGKADHPTGKPTDLPAPAESHPTGPPTAHPTGSPDEVPAP
jgi:hypothetical protein